MRERIARAFALHWVGDDNAIQTAGPAKTQGKPVWMCYLEHADIALAAMDMPTQAIVEAGEEVMASEGAHDCEVRVAPIYSAMIKEARKP